MNLEEEIKRADEIKEEFIRLIQGTRLTRKRLIAYLEEEIKNIKYEIQEDKDLKEI